MHIVLGGTGQIGSAVARTLLKRGEPVTVVTRDARRAADLQAAGAEIAVSDIRDARSLREIFRRGSRAFLLSPPAAPGSDTDAEERANVDAIVAALAGSGLEKVVAASTYGAHAGDRCGDLTTLYAFEERLRAQEIPAAIHRGAYYMSNWLRMFDGGRLTNFLPADLRIPMVAPEDLGEAAANRLITPPADVALRYVEGPERYSPKDVADALSEALNAPIRLDTIPREDWARTLRACGFSEAAADSHARMTAMVVDGGIESPRDPRRGPTSLRTYVRRHATRR